MFRLMLEVLNGGVKEDRFKDDQEKGTDFSWK